MTLLLGLLISWLLAYFRAGLWLWTISAFVLLWSSAPPASFTGSLPVWALALSLALLLNLPFLRRPILARPLLELFKQMLHYGAPA